MTFKLNSTVLALAVLVALPFASVQAKPGGTYKGTAKMSRTIPDGGPVMPFENLPIKIRLPNGKGGIGGVFQTTKASPPFIGNVPITGRVTKALERQGGRKHILTAKWSWKLGGAGFPGTAKGTNRIIVKKVGNTYKFQPPARVNLKGTGFKFKSKVTATK